MRLVMMGPPGAGKGTQAVVLSEKLSIPHISTGDMFRKAISDGTDLGKEAQSYIEKGQLVPDEVTIGIVRERLSEEDCKNGFLLDGFPRTVQQAEFLNEILDNLGTKLDNIIYIYVPEEDIVKRLTGRRVCRECGATYHILNMPAKVEGICDKCGAELYQRSDDTQETVLNRLKVYKEKTSPLIDFYEKMNINITINGNQPMPVVLTEIGKVLGREF